MKVIQYTVTVTISKAAAKRHSTKQILGGLANMEDDISLAVRRALGTDNVLITVEEVDGAKD